MPMPFPFWMHDTILQGRSLSDSTLPARQQYPIINSEKAYAADQSADNS
jgi:hypothetical protein